MFELHPDIFTPSDDTVIWRYLSLEKLLSIVSTRSLHFSRLDRFQDPWEGVWPKSLLKALGHGLKQNKLDMIRNVPDNLRKMFFVNCWHDSPHESAALWNQYANGVDSQLNLLLGS